ncbi:MAG: VacJ family lipoprotein [Nitrospinaceae bacterium]
MAKDIDIFLKRKSAPQLPVPETEEPPAEPRLQPPAASESQPSAEAPAPVDDFEDDPFGTEEEDLAELEPDRLHNFNRAMHNVNQRLYEYFFRPLGRGYRAVVPEGGRVVVRNVFENLKAPAKLLSSAVQGDSGKSKRVVSRFLINTTLGLGGALDVAKDKYQIKKVNEDFGQALAARGVESGDYLVLPFFGPSTTRDAVGRVVDSVLNPANYFGAGLVANAAMGTGERVNESSFYIDEIDSLNESAIDPYESQRHFFLELRQREIQE